MHTFTHLLIGAIIGLMARLESGALLIFILASVLIDIDHVLDYKAPRKVVRKGKNHLLDAIGYRKVNYLTPQRSLHFFHTFEILALLFLIGSFIPWVLWVALAFTIHIATDALGNVWNRNIGTSGGKDWIKYWFLTYYIIRGTFYNDTNH